MKQYWMVRINYDLPQTGTATQRYPLFETQNGAVAAVNKAAKLLVPFHHVTDDDKLIYDRDAFPKHCIPGVALIVIEPVTVDEAGAILTEEMATLINMACDEEEILLRKGKAATDD